MNQPATPEAESERSPVRSSLPTKRGPRTRVFALAAWLIVVASYAAVVFAFVCPQDFRNSSATYVPVATAAFMIRTFLFHFGLPLLVIAIGAVLIRRWRLLIATLPLVLFCVGPALWSYMPFRSPTVAGETVTVMSVNLLGANQNTAAMVAEVVAAEPDVLVLLEYRPHWHQAFQAALVTDYPRMDCVIRDDDFGLAIYSRRPAVGPVEMALPLGTIGVPQARAIVQIDDRRAALYCVHLMPPRTRRQIIEQRREFADLLDRLRDEELPIVLCGDFNFTNASAFADELERLGLIDVHRISGQGRGTTWCRLGLLRWLPGIRLDHIFISKELTSTHSRTGTGRGSDHRPVIAEIGFRS